MILRARIVLPVSSPPIEDGAVIISANRIAEVGAWSDLSPHRPDEIVDLGDVVLLPGLVNAHCHLDYTSMAGLFPPPKVFTDWIKLLTSTKAEWSYSDFAQSWLIGAKMLVRTGTTTVGDIETLPGLLGEVSEATPLRVLSFLEMTGVKSRRQPRAILEEIVHRLGGLAHSRCLAGLSPHSPYSTLPELMRLSAAAAHRRGWRICTHVAESRQELEMFLHARGEMFDWLRRSERDMSDCGLGSPVQHLERNGILNEKLLAVHANYLAETDAELLAQRKVSVVHCPRSHAYFRHDSFPFRELTRARVNICLGTDSLASVYKGRRGNLELNLFEEMREFAASNPEVPPEMILQMTTANPARALGMSGQVGELSPNAFADLIAVPFGGDMGEGYDAVLRHNSPIAASMIDGQWVVAPQANKTFCESHLQPA